MFKIITIAVLLALSGCATTDVAPPPNRATLNHPAMPSPIADREFQTKVIKDASGNLYIGMTYEDNLEFRKYMEDILKYVKDMKSTVCFYRTELKEPSCQIQPTVPAKKTDKKKAP